MSGAAQAVIVRLFAGLEAGTRDGRSTYELSEAEVPTVRRLRGVLGLADGATGIVLVNGLHACDEDRLHAGDEVALFPPLAGG
jgi:molybdopterin converting factor small subunit